MKVKRILLEAISGFIFWTGTLTPYMIFVVHTSWIQYWKWFGMQLIIIPILSPLSIRFIGSFVNFFSKKKKTPSV